MADARGRMRAYISDEALHRHFMGDPAGRSAPGRRSLALRHGVREGDQAQGATPASIRTSGSSASTCTLCPAVGRVATGQPAASIRRASSSET